MLKSLWFLSLSFTQVTDQGLEALKGLNQLKALNVGRTTISGAGIERLRKALPKVRVGNRQPPAAESQTIPLKREQESSSPSGLAAARRRFRHARHGFRGYRPVYVPPRSAVRVLLRSISKKIAQVVSGLAATIV